MSTTENFISKDAADLISKYAAEARARKVAAYVGILECGDIKAEAVARMTGGQWVTLANAAGMRPPSEETRRQVIEAIETKERIAHDLGRGKSDETET